MVLFKGFLMFRIGQMTCRDEYNYTYGGGGGSTENISAVLRATSGANILVEKGETAKDFYAANVDGISVFRDGVDRNFTPTSFSIYDSSVSYITSDYNTGWMYGDIRGAFLSDTDTTNVTGSELVTNGTFASNTSGWTAGSNATISSVSGQLNIVTGSSGGDLYAYQTITGLSAGEYILIVDVISNPSNRGILRVGSGGANTSNIGYIQYITGTGTKILNFTLTSSTDVTITLFNDVLNATGIWDNVTLRRAELDRSVSNNSLQVYGTITKSAVATGAELVAYSGFSGSNYLLQPHNSDLAPGTDPYCIMVWVKTGTSGADQYIYDRSSAATSTRDLLNIMSTAAAGNAASKLQWWHRDSSGNITDVQATDLNIADNAWHHVVAVMNGEGYYVYVDGVKSSIGGGVIRNIDNANNPPMYVGVRHSESAPMTGSLALFRYSHSCPSDEKIKKFYEDEKVLFQENAKCTLYGSSNAVTSVAFDGNWKTSCWNICWSL